jgi:NADH dehydrogenase
MHRVVIIGGGFGGLQAALSLRRAPVDVTLIDRRNFHLFQPLLYQVATGALSPANVAAPLRALFKRQKNTTVLLAEARGFDLAGHRVLLDEGELEFDSLIIAAGSTYNYFGHPEWETHAANLKTMEDATRIRAQILSAFEMAERLPPGPARDAWLTFVVVGGGPTGVEMVGQIAEIADFTLRSNFRSIDPATSKIYLIEAGDRVLAQFPGELPQEAWRALESLGVTVLLNSPVTKIDADSVTYRHDNTETRLHAHTILWAAGVIAPPLAAEVAKAASAINNAAATDRTGRLMVQPDLSLPGYPDVFVIGDMAHLKDEQGQPLPALAPVAQQEGRYVAELIHKRLTGQTMPPFHYRNRGTMATIGRYRAVADLGFVRLSGLLAWFAWLFVHLMMLVEFQNRVLVFIQWAWHFFTRNRSARLITNVTPLPSMCPSQSADGAAVKQTDRAAQ